MLHQIHTGLKKDNSLLLKEMTSFSFSHEIIQHLCIPILGQRTNLP